MAKEKKKVKNEMITNLFFAGMIISFISIFAAIVAGFMQYLIDTIGVYGFWGSASLVFFIAFGIIFACVKDEKWGD